MSRVQNLIEDAIRAEQRRRGTFGLQVDGPTLGVNYGYTLLAPHPVGTRARRSQWMNAKMTSRDVLVCGGCNNGRVPQRDKDGNRVGNKGQWPEHADCKGTGLRVNKRYGRCG